MANNIATPYEDLLSKILTEGSKKTDRTGTGTLSVFGAQMRFDLSKSFPLITTKKVFTRLIIEELLWMLDGDSNIEIVFRYRDEYKELCTYLEGRQADA